MKKTTYECHNCGKENIWKHSQSNKYCNNECQHMFQYTQRIVEWKETGKIGKATVKKYLSEQKEGCWECGISSWNGHPIVLELEHVDGNSSNDFEENLKLLCPNCHSQTSTYKNKNKGKGRHYRRQRYADGKSF